MPLHYGKAPRWLFNRMVKLARAVTEAIIIDQGVKGFLSKLSMPEWFQAFGCLLGFDWHSSGLTTTSVAALKIALNDTGLGVKIAGGKGLTSRKTPEELATISKDYGFSDTKSQLLITISRLIAKVDNTLLQDGYQLYHHSFIVDYKSRWVVIQQGLNATSQLARRYHWAWNVKNVKGEDNIKNLIEEPHSGIITEKLEKNVLNLSSRKSRQARNLVLELAVKNPLKTLKTVKKSLNMPLRHDLRLKDLNINSKIMLKALENAFKQQPESFEELLMIRGLGLKTLRALTLTSELIFNVKASWDDPAKYSFAHGGKDGWPFPVDKTTYDETITTLKEFVKNARLGDKERFYALKSLKSLYKQFNS